MDQAQWNAISALFDAAIDLPTEEREAFVRSTCNDDVVIATEVLDMLAADRALSSDPAGENFLSPLYFPNDALEPFLPSPPPFQPGEVLRERFRIVGSVGEGGMGHVFEAWDQELGIRIALKTIRPEVSNHAESLARFRREVRVGLQANHPNICRIFQIDHEIRQPDGVGAAPERIYFFTMEFLEGETLAGRLTRTSAPLPFDETLTFARHIAAALDCAHDLGVVHRDIKPANVMLVPSGASSRTASAGIQPLRAVVTDFGLAHLDPVLSEGNSSLSRTGFAAGTLRYMAPEQIEGGRISAATDVYAFGLLLFEMVTGERAYRAAGARPSPRALNPDLPPHWETVIERCLALDPDERFPGASDAVNALVSEEVLAPRRDRAVPIAASWTKRLGQALLSKPTLYFGGLAVAVALFIWAFRYYSQPSPLDPGAIVYLAPVHNNTGEKALDNIGELIQAGLAQSAHINLLDQSRVGDMLQRMTKPPDTLIDQATAREIALRAGARRVVFASVTGSKGSYSLDIDVQEPDSNSPIRARHHWTHSWPWKVETNAQNNETIAPALLQSVRDASNWIRSNVGESANDIARLDAPPEDVTTGNWEALADFASAKKSAESGDKESAIASYRRAVQSDPNFALAYAELASNLRSVARTAEAYDAYKKAISIEMDGRLSVRERYFIIASHADDVKDYPAAEEAFRSYTQLFPNDYLGWFYISDPLKEVGKSYEAILCLKKSLALHSGSGGARARIALNYMILGNAVEARTWIKQLANLGFSDLALYTEGIEDFLEGQYEASESSFGKLEDGQSQTYRATGYSMLARVQAERREYSAALTTLDAGIKQSIAEADRADAATMEVDRAAVLCEAGRYRDCIQNLDEAVSDASDPLLIIWESSILGQSLDAIPKAQRGEIVARLRTLGKRIEGDDSDTAAQIARHRVAGEILLAQGEAERATEEFRTASRLDSAIADREYLGRALSASAAKQHDKHASETLLNEALSAYERTILHPANIWHQAWEYLPGALAQETAAHLSVEKRRHAVDKATSSKASLVNPAWAGDAALHPQQAYAEANTLTLWR